MLCLFNLSPGIPGILALFWVIGVTSGSSLLNVTESLCAKASESDSLIPNSSTKDVHLSNDVIPTLSSESQFSNAVSVTTLSSTLIDGFGDSYAIAVIGVGNDDLIEWQSVSATGSALPLPPIFYSFNNSTPENSTFEVQYDNRYGLIHVEANFVTYFPTNILILSPTDRIRFKALSEGSSSLLPSECELHSLWFTFFKTTSTITKFLDNSQPAGKHILDIQKCKAWPFSNVIYRLCPGYKVSANGTTPKQNFSTIFNQNTKSSTMIDSKGFSNGNTLTEKMGNSVTSRETTTDSDASSTKPASNSTNGQTSETPFTAKFHDEKPTSLHSVKTEAATSAKNEPKSSTTESQILSTTTTNEISSTVTPKEEEAMSSSDAAMGTSEIIREPRSTSPMPSSTSEKNTEEQSWISSTSQNSPQTSGETTQEATTSGSTKEATVLPDTTLSEQESWISSTSDKQNTIQTSPDGGSTKDTTVPPETTKTESNTETTIPDKPKPTEFTTSSIEKSTIPSSSTINNSESPTTNTERIERETTEISSPSTIGGDKTSMMPSTSNDEMPKQTEISSRSAATSAPDSLTSTSPQQSISLVTPTTSTVTTSKGVKLSCISNNETSLCKYCTKDAITKQCVATVYPQLIDVNVKGPKITVKLDLNKTLEEIGKVECKLQPRDSSQNIGIETDIENGNSIEIEFKPQSNIAEMRLSCSIDGTEFLINKTIYFASFQTLVEHKTPFSSGFDSTVEYKTVFVTFKEALPSQFIIQENNNAFCVLDQKTGARYSAKLETPSVMSCNINGSVTIGSHKLYAIRRQELENATFQYQTPLTFSVSSSSSSTPAPTQNTKTAEFLPNLKGILVTFDLASDIQNRTFNCSKAFMGSETFGSMANCQMNGAELTITFGSSPTILPNQPVLIRSGALSNAFLDGGQPNATTQYDAIALAIPVDAVSPSVTLQEPSTAISCQQNVNISISNVAGDGGRNMTYKWRLKSGGSPNLGTTLSQSALAFIQIPFTDIGSAASISVEACNFAPKCSESNTVEIKTSQKTFQFTVEIAGIPSTPLPSTKISLSAIPNFATCNSTRDLSMTNISYEWSINGSSVSRDSIYVVPAKTYAPFSNLNIGILVKYWNSDSATMLEATSEKSIVYGMEGLVGIVDGIERAIASDTELIIDARQSFDPNTGSNNLTHLWSCSQAGGINCTNLNLSWKSKLFVVASGVLKSGQNYTFTDTISNELGSSTQISVNVQILQGSVPVIQLVPSTEKALPLDAYIRVQGYVQSKTELSTEWQLFKSADNSIVDISSVFPQTKRNFSENGLNTIVSVSFTIPPGNSSKYPEWKGLNPGMYTVRLKATNIAGSSFTEHSFEVLSLPKKPTLTMSPSKDMFALQTPIQLAARDISSSQEKLVSLRFGFRTLLVNNRTTDKWFKGSVLDYYKTILAAAWPEPHAACNERIAYQGLLEICSNDGACSQTQSDRFIVQHPVNSSVAVSQILASAVSDIASGDTDGAYVKLEAIQNEQCNSTLDGVIVNALISKVLTKLQNSTDSEALLSGVGICTAFISSASKENIEKIMDLLLRANKAATAARSSSPTTTSSGRSKRSTATGLAALAATNIPPISEAFAEVMLSASDTLLASASFNPNSDIGYPKVVNDQLSGFCSGIDSTKILKAEGKEYTKIQAEGLSPIDGNFLNQTYSVANVPNSVTFGKNFQAAFKSYQCGEGKLAACTDICFATAFTSKQALIISSNLQKYYFGSNYNSITFTSSMSDFYLIRFVDPNSGLDVPLPSGAGFNFSIPLLSYAAANYYSCFVFINGIWRNNMCKSNDYATKDGTKYTLDCYCEVAGMLGVFTVSPPTPAFYPPYNEIELKFNLSTTIACTRNQYSTFLSTLSSTSVVAPERFKNYTCLNGTNLDADPASIVVRLRPPFRPTHVSNSFAMQAIKRAVKVGSRMIAYSKIEVTALNETIIYRTLQGDDLGRRVPLRIQKLYKDVIVNETEMNAIASKWAKGMAKDMNIDPQRFKNPLLTTAMNFNITITLPFEGEQSLSDPPLTAEELSLWIKEQTEYVEIELRDNNDQIMPYDPLGYLEIVRLAVLSPTNTLMTVLAITLSTIFVLSSLFIGGLVFLKIRTDRLIQQHNENIRTIQIDASQPDIPLNVIPFESNGLVIDRKGMISEEMHEAADTVILGRHRASTKVRHR